MDTTHAVVNTDTAAFQADKQRHSAGINHDLLPDSEAGLKGVQVADIIEQDNPWYVDHHNTLKCGNTLCS